MNCEKEVYVDMNEVMDIFHSFDNGTDKDPIVSSSEQLNLVDEIIKEFNLIESNIKQQYKSNNHYKDITVTPFQCVNSNNTQSNNGDISAKKTKENGVERNLNREHNGQFTIKGNGSCVNSSKCCCCVVDMEKITQLIELVNTLHSKLNETNTKLNALQFRNHSFPKVNFPSENTPYFTNEYAITCNNSISYEAITTQHNNNNLSNISQSNKQKRSYNEAQFPLFNANISKKQQPITSFLHKQFKNK